MVLKKKKNSGRGCLILLGVVVLLGVFLSRQQIYYIRQQSGYTRILGNEKVLYAVIATDRMGDQCSLLLKLGSFFMWHPSAKKQRHVVKVYRLSRAGLQQGETIDMTVRGGFFTYGTDLVYMKTKTRYEDWRPVWVWREGIWKPMRRGQALEVMETYTQYRDRKAAGKSLQERIVDVSHTSLWGRQETRIGLQGQMFNFKTYRKPSPEDSSREERRLEVEGLYGFHAELLEEDQAWRAVSREEYRYWFGENVESHKN